ncbi:MAG: hypothetical protein JNJ77_01940, partial [Planctomycetia bacterium]|nr:hypothetical protein [Planctomycetia bacterium]
MRLKKTINIQSNNNSMQSFQDRNRRARSFKPMLEILEDRNLPAIITWIGGSGNWNTATNWNTGTIPANGDDVIIPDLGAIGEDLTITYSSGSVSLNSISTAEKLQVSGSTLTTNIISGTGTLTISSGTATINGTSSISNVSLSGGTLTGSGTLTVQGALNWTNGGIMSGTGTTVVAPTGTMNITTSTGDIQLSRTLQNDGS